MREGRRAARSDFLASAEAQRGLALVTAISFDLDKPFWAVVASMMLQARPETGLVVEKAGFLVLGSIAGALLALLILDNFIPYLFVCSQN